MTLILHHAEDARSVRTYWLLGEIGVPFEVVTHPFDKSLRSPDYLARHPLGRVPCLEDGSDCLIESGAICEWLCETRAPHLWRAPGTPERADWLQWLHYAETVGQQLANLTQQHIVIREDRDRSPLLMSLEARRLGKALGVLDAALGDHEWILPGGFSGVDTAIGYSVDVARRFHSLDPFPALAAYHARCQARPAFQAAQPKPGARRIYARDFYPPPDV